MFDDAYRSRYDAVVVGARAAGAATAMLLARRGLSVLALDQGAYGSDTLSTMALMRGGVAQLWRWGLLDRLERAGTPPVRATTFHYGGESVRVEIRPRDGVDALYAPRRMVLDAMLVDAACEAGADVRNRVRVQRLLQDGGVVRGVALESADGRRHEVESSIVIGADGRNSTVARQVNAPESVSGRAASAVIYGFFVGLPQDGYHWYYERGVSVGVIPTNDGASCVFVSTPPERFKRELAGDLDAGFHQVLREGAPALAGAVQEALRVGGYRGFAGQRGYLKQAWGPGWALVGDAGYFKDPITAHGITDGLRDAELLANAVCAGSKEALADYQLARDELSLGLFQVTDAIASYDWDLASVKQLHRRLSDEMKQEGTAMLAKFAELEPRSSAARYAGVGAGAQTPA